MLDAGHVQRFVEIAGVARALAEVGDDDVVDLFHLEGEAETDGHRQVGAEHAGVAEDAELADAAVERRIPALRHSRILGQHLRHHVARLTPFIRNAPRSRCSGQIQSSFRSPKQVPTMIASWPMPV